jgi:hypothetical protein
MIWLTWRQLRTQTLVAVAVLAAAAVYLLITGTQLRHSYTSDLAGCRQFGSCSDVLDGLQSRYNGPLDLVGLLLMAAPALVGIFWGAPLIAGELERGTHYLVWNQSTTRARWLAIKLAMVALVAVATVGLLSLLVTWWAGPLDAISGSRWGTEMFGARNVAPLGCGETAQGQAWQAGRTAAYWLSAAVRPAPPGAAHQTFRPANPPFPPSQTYVSPSSAEAALNKKDSTAAETTGYAGTTAFNTAAGP